MRSHYFLSRSHFKVLSLSFTLTFLSFHFNPMFIFSSHANESGSGMKISNVPTEADTTITIQKGKPASGRHLEFEMITDSEEISGDPSLGRKAAYQSWKTACNDWKKEIRESHRQDKDTKIISLNCGSAKLAKIEGSQYTYTSEGKFKIRALKNESEQ